MPAIPTTPEEFGNTDLAALFEQLGDTNGSYLEQILNGVILVQQYEPNSCEVIQTDQANLKTDLKNLLISLSGAKNIQVLINGTAALGFTVTVTFFA